MVTGASLEDVPEIRSHTVAPGSHFLQMVFHISRPHCVKLMSNISGPRRPSVVVVRPSSSVRRRPSVVIRPSMCPSESVTWFTFLYRCYVQRNGPSPYIRFYEAPIQTGWFDGSNFNLASAPFWPVWITVIICWLLFDGWLYVFPFVFI